MKKVFLTVLCILTIFSIVKAQYAVSSPHSTIEAKVEVGNQINYSVNSNGKQVISNSVIRFEFKQAPPMGDDMTVLKTSSKVINETWTPVLKRKSTILNNCNARNLKPETLNLKLNCYA